jgi:hypothetical protein
MNRGSYIPRPTASGARKGGGRADGDVRGRAGSQRKLGEDALGLAAVADRGQVAQASAAAAGV